MRSAQTSAHKEEGIDLPMRHERGDKWVNKAQDYSIEALVIIEVTRDPTLLDFLDCLGFLIIIHDLLCSGLPSTKRALKVLGIYQRTFFVATRICTLSFLLMRVRYETITRLTMRLNRSPAR